MNPLAIGNVRSIIGNNIEVTIKKDFKSMYLTHEGKLYQIGQLGSYVVINAAYEKIIGIVSEIKMQEVIALSESNTVPKGYVPDKIMKINLIGTISDNLFEQGVQSYPLINDEVCLANEEDIEILFRVKESEKHISIGKFSQNDKIDVLVDVDSLLSRHVAIVGSTGSGKSTSIASFILNFANKYDKPHIIVFDLHGEYSNSEDLMKKKWINIVDSEKLKIPFWLLNFDEWREILSVKWDSANQIKALRETLIEIKQDSIKNFKDPTIKPNIDIPIYYSFVFPLRPLR